MIEYNKRRIEYIWRALALFTIAFSYSSFSYEHGLSSLKYVGIALLVYNMIIRDLIGNGWTLEKRYFSIIALLLSFFCISAIFQNSSFSGLLMTAAYALYIGCVICYSDKIVRDADDVIALGAGTFFGIVASILTTPNSLVGVYSGSISARVRVYGGFSHPNAFGATAMASCICMLIGIFYGKTGLKAKIAMIIIAGFSAYFCYLSDSSSAIYGTIFFLILMVYYMLSSRLKLPRGATLIFLLLIVLVLSNYILGEVGISKLLGRTDTFSSVEFDNVRQLLIGDGLVEASERGMWGAEFALTTTLLKTGILGLFVFGIIFIYFFARSRTVEYRGIFNAVFATFLITCVAEAYITNITNTYPVIMWILMSATSNGAMSGNTTLSSIEFSGLEEENVEQN